MRIVCPQATVLVLGFAVVHCSPLVLFSILSTSSTFNYSVALPWDAIAPFRRTPTTMPTCEAFPTIRLWGLLKRTKGQVWLLAGDLLSSVLVDCVVAYCPVQVNLTLFTSVKAEKVNNPYGSTAGAGSGDFHVYRHARAREAERWKQMNEEEQEKSLEEQYRKTLETYQTEAEQRTAQRRRKRQRLKEAKLKKKNLALCGINLKNHEDSDRGDDEFTYTPLTEQKSFQGADQREGRGETSIEIDKSGANVESDTLPKRQGMALGEEAADTAVECESFDESKALVD